MRQGKIGPNSHTGDWNGWTVVAFRTGAEWIQVDAMVLSLASISPHLGGEEEAVVSVEEGG